MSRFLLASQPGELERLRQPLRQSGAGGYCSFEGWVRDSNEGRAVGGLDYEAYAVLATSEGEAILDEALARFEIIDARCMHRVGQLELGDLAVWIGVSAAHRDAAFSACRYIIDEVKLRLPIWKKERYLDGDTQWVACSHHSGDHEHKDVWTSDDGGHGHGHGHDAHADADTDADAGKVTPFKPDYSRQSRLAEVGEEGQRRLAASRVLVIGAGGLGCPVLSYLAGAGIGTLGVVDGDRVEASNLHRQTLYGVDDIGLLKVDAAARRLAAINPTVSVRRYPQPLRAEDVVAVFAEYDLVLECTDAMASRYLSSDAAVLSGTPVIFASVYQYEGQLHVYSGRSDAPCLRCLWPQEPDPAVVGSCVEAGVLGPVVGALGSLQAMEGLKILLGLPGGHAADLVLVDLLGLTTRHIELPPAGECGAEGCAATARQTLARLVGEADLERGFDDLSTAVAAGYRLVDLREPAEIAAMPLAQESLRVSPAELVAQVEQFRDGRYLLVCASGRRSLHGARSLRQAGAAAVYSLAGGVAALHPSGVPS